MRLTFFRILLIGIGFVVHHANARCSDTHVQTYIRNMNASSINRIDICNEYLSKDVFQEHAFSYSVLTNQEYPITNRVSIARLVELIVNGVQAVVPLDELPFSGSGPYQIFVTENDVYLATHLFQDNPSLVAVALATSKQDEYQIIGEDLILISSPDFVLLAHQCMEGSHQTEPEAPDDSLLDEDKDSER